MVQAKTEPNSASQDSNVSAGKLSILKSALAKKLNALSSTDIFVVISLLATIPALTTGSMPAALNLTEDFGWVGFDQTIHVTESWTFSLRYIWAAVAALLVLFWATHHRKWTGIGGWRRYLFLGVLPALVLTLTPVAQIGSSMRYDGSALGIPVCEKDPQAPLCIDDVAKRLPQLPWFGPLAAKNPAVAGSELVLITERQVIDRQQFWFALPYTLVCMAYWCFLLWHLGYRQSYLALTALVASLVGLGWTVRQWRTEWADWLSFDWVDWLLVAIYPLFATFALLAFVRMLFRLFRDNRDIWPSYSNDRKYSLDSQSTDSKTEAEPEKLSTLGVAVLIALAIAIPFFSVFAGAIWIERHYKQLASNIAYSTELCPKNEASIDCAVLVPVRVGQRFPRDDAHLTATLRLDVASSEIRKAIEPIEPERLAQDARNQAIAAYERVLPPNVWQLPGLAHLEERCKPISLKKRPLFISISASCFFRKIKSDVMNGIYQSPRNRVLAVLTARLDEAVAKVKDLSPNNLPEQKTELLRRLDGIFTEAKVKARQEIDLSFLAYALYSLLGLLLLVFALLRSFYTILARRLYPQNMIHDKGFYSLIPDASESTGKINFTRSKDMKLDIILLPGEVFYVKPSIDIANATRSVALPPQMLSGVFSRLAARRYFLRKVTADTKSSNRKIPRPKPNLTDDSGARFIAVRLEADKHIAFRWSHLVGFTNNTTLRSLISFRMPLMAMGHIRIPTITGPGLVIFKIRGDAQVIDENAGASESVAPFRLVAWDLDATFRISSARGFFPMYFDGCQFRVAKDDMAIIDVGQDGRYMPGLLHNLWGMLRP